MEKAKILIVDDDLDFTDATKAILESHEYVVVTAPNKTEAMEKVRADKPDLILLDVMMIGGQDGFEMARDIKKDSQLREIPILMLTAVKEKTGIGFKSVAGDPDWLPVEGFMDKPIDPQELQAEIERLLSKKS